MKAATLRCFRDTDTNAITHCRWLTLTPLPIRARHYTKRDGHILITLIRHILPYAVAVAGYYAMAGW